MTCQTIVQHEREVRQLEKDTNRSAALSIVQSVRSELERYTLDHDHRPPALSDLAAWTVMTGKTDMAGNVVADGAFGPYLMMVPVNPITGSSQVVSPVAPSKTAGWVYDEISGRISLIVPAEALVRSALPPHMSVVP